MSKLTATRGDSYILSLTVKVNSVITDITGWIVFFTIKNSPDDLDADAVLKKYISTHTDAANGLTAVELTAAETALLAGTYYYDLQIKKPDGTIVTALNSVIEFSKDITIRTTNV